MIYLLDLARKCGYRAGVLSAHVDESYSDDWYYMAALVCDGAGAKGLTTALDKIVANAHRDYGVSAQAELHGYELFQGERWWADIPPRARISVYGHAFHAVAEHCRTLIMRGVHVARLRERYPHPDQPHSIVLMHLMERVHEYVLDHSEFALVIADEVGDQARHRSDFAKYQQLGTWGYRSRKLTRIIDTLHFAPSDSSRLLQAIDLIVFLYRRLETHAESDPRAKRANEQLWARIEPKVWHKLCWHP